jgi:hypothetical protein
MIDANWKATERTLSKRVTLEADKAIFDQLVKNNSNNQSVFIDNLACFACVLIKFIRKQPCYCQIPHAKYIVEIEGKSYIQYIPPSWIIIYL